MARVLVVDDDYAVREMLTMLIEDEAEHEVVTATNGKEAWDVLHAAPVDAVVCDLNMPVMNGAELVRAMRADPQARATPVIMASAGVFLERVDPDLPVDVLLEKPFDLSTLLACLTYALNGNHAGRRKTRVGRRRAATYLNHMLHPAQRQQRVNSTAAG